MDTELLQVFGAMPIHHTDIVEGAWEAGPEIKKADTAAELRHMYAWFRTGGDPESKSDYKFPHHPAGTDTPASLNAVRNALARLPQADIPDADRDKVEAHLRAHLNDAHTMQEAAVVAPTSFGAIAVHHTATVEGTWDGGAAMKAASTPAELRHMNAWFATGGDPARKGDYKFPHHAAGVDTPANLAGVRNALARLPQADIPAGDRAGVEAHLRAHLNDARPGTAASNTDPVLMHIYDTETLQTASDGDQEPITMYSQGKWKGVLAVEGSPTGDGREFAEGALEWRDLPLTLYWQRLTADGHSNSAVVGKITDIERDGKLIRGKGTFDMNGEDGKEAHRLVHGGFLRGLSVTLDDVSDNDVEAVWPEPADGDEVPEESGIMALFAKPEKIIFHHARIMDTCLTGQPALQEAFLELEMDDENEPTTMSHVGGVTASAPLAPPSAWFDNPRLGRVTPLTVEDSGQIYGHLARWGVCHTSFAGTCITPPRESEFAYFTTGEIVTADGEHIPVGQLTMGANHAPANIGARPAAAHYENTGHAVADVTAGADAFGIWVAGALRPQITEREVRVLRASALSGDWRRIAGSLRLVAALVVNVPGFPIPRTRTYSRDGEQQALVASGVLLERRDVHLSPRIADRLAASIGRDRGTRLRELRDRVHPSLGNVQVD